jgi:hypothetical protein
MTQIAGSGSISQRHGSADPDLDPHHNVIDPQHWLKLLNLAEREWTFALALLRYPADATVSSVVLRWLTR